MFLNFPLHTNNMHLPTTPGKLTPEAYTFISTYLAHNRDQLMAALEGLTPAQWAFRPNDNAWTLAEVAEHLAVAEQGLLRGAQKVVGLPAAPERLAEVKVSYEDIVHRTTNRGVRVEAPERVIPTGKFADGPAALRAFAEQREAALAWLEQAKEQDLHHHFGSHPTLGTLDASQLLVFMAAHCERHLGQIAELKAQAAFPA
jgi:uncharacterized damage-inducible protein DinB